MKRDDVMETSNGVLKASLGGYGGIVIDDTDEHTPTSPYNFIAIQVLSEAVVTAEGNIEDMESVTIPAGMTVVGEFTSITLASGTVIAYQGG